MTVASVMTDAPACCTPKSPLTEVAKMMVDNDCGQIPVVENLATRKLAGVITDRDIAIRIVAQGINSSEAVAGDCMSSPCITATPEDSIQDCCTLMETNKIRRVPVVNANDEVIGIVSLADVARHTNASATAAVVKEVSSIA
ncbi:MAG: CBS domain-containing protein [Arenimonas sp.]